MGPVHFAYASNLARKASITPVPAYVHAHVVSLAILRNQCSGYGFTGTAAASVAIFVLSVRGLVVEIGVKLLY